MPFKLLGAALDALDDPERVNLKRAYIQAAQAGRLSDNVPLDPYDVLTPLLVDRCGPAVLPFGKIDLPGWLTPRPEGRQGSSVQPDRYRAFLDGDGIEGWVEVCARLVERDILPDIPCLIAVDHGMTAGPLRALAGRFAPEETTVVILDSHFDAIPARLRALPGQASFACGPGNCGSFLVPLIEDGTLLPENLIVVGVSDYAYPHTAEPYRQAYLSLIARGVTVIPREEVEDDSFPAELEERLCRGRGRRLYVSLDADAGALECVHAARFLDTVGLSEEAILGTARLLRGLIDRGRFELIGLDAAEIDVHLLGIEDDQGMPDRTAEVCAGFLSTLMRLDS
jgi:arginase family enzyme